MRPGQWTVAQSLQSESFSTATEPADGRISAKSLNLLPYQDSVTVGDLFIQRMSSVLSSFSTSTFSSSLPQTGATTSTLPQTGATTSTLPQIGATTSTLPQTRATTSTSPQTRATTPTSPQTRAAQFQKTRKEDVQGGRRIALPCYVCVQPYHDCLCTYVQQLVCSSFIYFRNIFTE